LTNVKNEAKLEDITYKKVSVLVDKWLELHKGETFDLDLICRQLQITERENRHYVSQKLSYEVQVGKLEKSNRIYRYINKDKDIIDWYNSNIEETINIKFPKGRDGTKFGFDGCVCISPGDIIVVAGVSNMGKTTFAQNFLWENMDNFPCVLMGNEYTPVKFKRRISRMTWNNPLKEDGKPKFELIRRLDNWSDIIEPDKITIIDWISLPANELYNIGHVIQGIQSKVGNGIALIVLQKDESSNLGRGRAFSEELASLYLTIDKGRMTVRKAKEWFEHDPNREVYGFDITNGGVEFRNIQPLIKCSYCKGTGQYKGGECFICHGSGYVDKENDPF
jgi:hypothetical protein